jgi:hypothetical protein
MKIVWFNTSEKLALTKKYPARILITPYHKSSLLVHQELSYKNYSYSSITAVFEQVHVTNLAADADEFELRNFSCGILSDTCRLLF